MDVRPRISTLIVDFDNTLFDWFAVWHGPFSAMVEAILAEGGVERDTLLKEIKEVHQAHGTSEYAFLLESLPSLQKLSGSRDAVVARYAQAIETYRELRRELLALYPGVEDTLIAIRASGCRLVIFTESMGYYSNYRLRRLGLDPLFDYLISPPDHALPEAFDPEVDRVYAPENYELEHAVHQTLPEGTVKPDPQVLLQIVESLGADPGSVAYVGDSLVKDIGMAQAAGILDVHARYGEQHTKEEYKLLQAVSHWTKEMIARESNTRPEHIRPTYVIDSFSELRSLFVFEAP